MGIYLNQIKSKYKSVQTERLVAHFKRLNFSPEAIQAKKDLLFPKAAPRVIDSSPLSSTELSLLKKAVACTGWKEMAKVTEWTLGSVGSKLSKLAYRYLRNLKKIQ